MCSSISQIIICFECKQQIKKKQQFSLCNSCNQNYHSQCFNKHSNEKNSINLYVLIALQPYFLFML